MKKILTTLLIVFTVTLCKAQWVTIPDTNFVAWLQSHYPSCMNGSQMDTTCSEIISATIVDCSNQFISNLTGIQYFDGLKELDCNDNDITILQSLPHHLNHLECRNNELFVLPNFPASFLYLDCAINYITNIPVLPNSITDLYFDNNLVSTISSFPSSLKNLTCSVNLLTNIPALPNSVITIYCGWNGLTNLPALPNSLTLLYCNNNNLVNLPSLPTSLIELYCIANSLTNLPILPNSLVYLNCLGNDLMSLPQLPNSLAKLECSFNQLTSLPQLPIAILEVGCGHNQLISLPVLPSSLQLLGCDHNQLLNIPSIPISLEKLIASFNQLTTLPTLPPSMEYFIVNNNPALLCMPILQNFTGLSWSTFMISNTGITCLPNLIQHTGYIAAIDTMPICTCVYPSGITTSNITSTSAKVNWSAECCSQFQIQGRVTGTTTWSTVTAVANATSKNLTALTPGTTYDLRMRVKCTDGTTFSSWSPIQTFTTLVTCVAPTGVTVTNLTQTHATINWAAVTGAYSYKFSGRKLGTTAWTTYTIYAPLTVKQLNGLTANTTYQYRMQTVCNASGVPTSPWTAISTFSTPLRLEDGSAENATIDFSIYPNPVSQLLTVTSDFSIGDEIEIKDLLGRTLISSTTNYELSTTNYSIDVSNLSAAQYFISIRRNDGSVFVKQFVKE